MLKSARASGLERPEPVCVCVHTSHSVTPVALSFVRAKQSLTKRQSQGVEEPPKQGGVTEWGVTLDKHAQCYMS